MLLTSWALRRDAFIKESYLALFAKSRSRKGQRDMVFPKFGERQRHGECNSYSTRQSLYFANLLSRLSCYVDFGLGSCFAMCRRSRVRITF